MKNRYIWKNLRPILFLKKWIKIINNSFFIISVIFFTFFSVRTCWSDTSNDKSLFSARIAHVNDKASLIRIFVDFHNAKFINQKDSLYFWTPHMEQKRCLAYVLARTKDYLLLKVIDYKICESHLKFYQGAYIQLASEDLNSNMKIAVDLMQILQKKRLAVASKLHHEKKQLDNYIEKIESINVRYDVLKKKLEQEWQQELENIQLDKLKTLRNFKAYEVRLGEIDHKMEQYRVHDQHLEWDRWSLDPQLYYKK
jgi:hypothetical protein